jgi:hypothetical protein
MFFTRTGLEQASDQWTAQWKASRFPREEPLADLCCGIGGDLLALAARGPIVGVDREPAVAWFAAANLASTGWAEAGGRRVQAAEVAGFPLADVAAWHLDPDRRCGGRRTTRVDHHEPGLEAIEALRSRRSDAAIKLAPVCDLPAAWRREAELEWIGRGGECRQLVAWFGKLATHPARRRATVLGDARGGGPARTILETAGAELPHAARIGRYVFEPDAAVLAAGLCASLAAEHGLARIGPLDAYLTGDQPLADPAIDGFEVTDVLPFDLKRLRALVGQRGIGRLEIKKRGLREDPDTIRRRLRVRGEAEAVLLVAPAARGMVAVLARRLRVRKRGQAPYLL